MKNRLAIVLLFLSTSFSMAFGQNDALPQRQLPALEMFKLKEAKLMQFKSMLHRFEVAWSESDIQSLIEIQPVLLQLIQEEASESNDTNSTINSIPKDDLSKIVEKVKSIQFSPTDKNLGEKVETALLCYRQFLESQEKKLIGYYNQLPSQN